MSSIVRVGDSNNGGGVVLNTPQSTFKVNNKLVSVSGSVGSDHGSGNHGQGSWATVSKQSTFNVGGILADVVGGSDTCGHVRSEGSADFNIF